MNLSRFKESQRDNFVSQQSEIDIQKQNFLLGRTIQQPVFCIQAFFWKYRSVPLLNILSEFVSSCASISFCLATAE